jgi:hypothetical protein
MDIDVAIANLRCIEQGLGNWLTDNTDLVFEEESEVDTARGLIDEAVRLLEARKRREEC